MTKKDFWIGVVCLYGIGLAVVLSILASQQSMPPNSGDWGTLLTIPLVWGLGPIALTLIWLTFKRWNLDAAKFGLLVFAGLYLVIVFVRWWWQALL